MMFDIVHLAGIEGHDAIKLDHGVGELIGPVDAEGAEGLILSVESVAESLRIGLHDLFLAGVSRWSFGPVLLCG